MNILLIQYGLKNQNGRGEQLYRILKRVDPNIHRIVVSKEKVESTENEFCIAKPKNSKYNKLFYFFYYLSVKKICKKLRNKIDIVVLDNSEVSLLYKMVKRVLKPKHILQDMREFLFPSDTKNLLCKIIYKKEKETASKVDFVIVANQERANLLTQKISLKEKPLVLENFRSIKNINYQDKVKEFDYKYQEVFKKPINIIYNGGLMFSRGLKDFLEAFINLNSENTNMIIIGYASPSEISYFNSFIKAHNCKNIYYFPPVKFEEMKYLLDRSQIGLIQYNKDNLNNIYCASGKIYEYLQCNLPIICSSNESLLNFCNKYKVGIASDNYLSSLKELISNYSFYRNNTCALNQKFDCDELENKFIKELKDELKY